MSAATLYSVIDAKPDADEATLKKAVRKALRETHPDMNGGVASERYHAVQEAADVLLDASARAAYDRDIGLGTTSSAETTGEPDSSRARRAADRARKRHSAKRKYDHDVPIVDVRTRFTAPSVEETMWPAANSGKHGTVLSLVFGCLMAASVVGVLVTTWMNGAPLDSLGFFAKAGQILGQSVRTLMTVAMGFLALARTLKLGIGGQGVIVGGLFSLAVLFTSSGTWESLFAFGLSVTGFICVIGFHSTTRRRTGEYYLDAHTSMNMTSYGEPGAGLADSGFEAAAVKAGTKGERATAEVLDSYLAGFPGVRIFHSMKFAPDSNADVDHVVVCGKKIALIDSKLWPSAAYEWKSGISAEILEYNPKGTQRTRASKMPEAKRSYEELFPGYDVQVWILIHPASGEKDFSVSNQYHPDGVLLGSADSVVNEVGTWFAEGQGKDDAKTAVVDRVLLNKLACLLKS